MNILIKLMSIVSLVIAPSLAQVHRPVPAPVSTIEKKQERSLTDKNTVSATFAPAMAASEASSKKRIHANSDITASFCAAVTALQKDRLLSGIITGKVLCY